MLAKGWIKPSVSKYSNPVLFIRKITGEFQMWIYFHSLITNIKLVAFPLPHIADLWDKLGNVKYSNSIELAAAYH